MKQQGMDKRILKTKNRLKNALILLLQEKKLEDISVVELSKSALINRKTFYLHYQEVSSILLEIENNLSNSLYLIIKEYEFSFASFKEFIYNIFNTIMQDEYVVQLLKTTYYASTIVDLIHKILIESLIKKIKIKVSSNIMKVHLMIEYHVYGSVKLFVDWLNGQFKGIEFKDFIAFVYETIMNSSYKKALE